MVSLCRSGLAALLSIGLVADLAGCSGNPSPANGGSNSGGASNTTSSSASSAVAMVVAMLEGRLIPSRHQEVARVQALLPAQIVPRRAASRGPGMTNCGPAERESCCTSLEVRAGRTTGRTTANGGYARPTGAADPATVSGFRLDKYTVTVGRFRQFVNGVERRDGLPAGRGLRQAHALERGPGAREQREPGDVRDGLGRATGTTREHRPDEREPDAT